MKARHWLPLLGAISLLGFACGDDSATGSGDAFTGGAGGGVACDFSEGCGKACSGDKDCPTGLYCGAGDKCTADCRAGDTCPGGGMCDASGRCSTGAILTTGSHHTTSTSTSSEGAGGEGGGCGDVTVAFAPQIPTVTLLIDQSGSMTTLFGGVQRWEAVYDAVMDPGTGPVKALEQDVRFGLALYTGESGTCPELAQVMPPALGNYDAMNAVWMPAKPINNTPTGESVTAIVPSIVAITDPGPKLILLATDGDPDTCADPNSNGTQPPKDVAIAAVKGAHDQGITTVVLAVGDQVSAQHQQDMANAGAGLATPAPAVCLTASPDPALCATTYKPSDQAALIDAFNTIIKGQRTCVFTLDGTVVQGKECLGKVTIDGVTIGCNDPDGWKLDDPMTIEFTGAACDQIKSEDDVHIKAHFPCDAASVGSGPH